jgi:hypothetical protein
MCWDCIVDLAVEAEEAESTARRTVGYRESDDIILKLNSEFSQVRENVGSDVVWYFGHDQRVFRAGCRCEA